MNREEARMLPESIFPLVLQYIAVVPAIVLHEVAHGYVAWRLGDPTAKSRGRLSLNPLVHVDPVGTVLIPLVLVILRTPFLFGYAKPVPINPSNFRNPLRGMLYVAASGPGTNFVLAVVTSGLVRAILLGVPENVLTATSLGGNLLRVVLALLYYFVIWNIILTVINLIPVPPLDGSRILAHFLPAEGRRFLASIERFGFLILIALLALGVLGPIFQSVLTGWTSLLGQPWLEAASEHVPWLVLR
jgi:Zn-dependent protease